MNTPDDDAREENQALRLGQLLRDGLLEELAERDARAPEFAELATGDTLRSDSASEKSLEEASAGTTDRVRDLRSVGSKVALEDTAWLRAAEERLCQGVRERAPSHAVISALTKAQADESSVYPGGKTFQATRSGRWWVKAGGAMALAAAAVLGFTLSFQEVETDKKLTFSVVGAAGDGSALSSLRVMSSGRVTAPPEGERTLAFSDGSRLAVRKASSLRVRQTDERGAEVVVERGRVDSEVKHRQETSWSVFAGPYEIQVVGTKFTTQWDPDAQALLVLLHEGAVRVIGGEIEDQVLLEPGQQLVAQSNQRWSVAPLSSSVPSSPKDVREDPAAVGDAAAPSASEPNKGASAVKPSASPPWDQLLRDGRFAEIMAEAETLGVDQCINTCPVIRLRALADAARYTGQAATAEKALVMLRSRAPAEASRAGYLLGSLHEARGQASAALQWYAGYLSEAPSGSFAAEALAGRMRAELALGRKADAKASASEYLRRYPSGASAATATRVSKQK